MDRVIGVWHHFAPRDGYTKFGNGVGSNPLDFFFNCIQVHTICIDSYLDIYLYVCVVLLNAKFDCYM